MPYGASMKLMWEIMERLRGAACEYHDSQIVPDARVVFLPQVRATFLREWPGSPNPHTRKATYQRVFQSVASAGGFTRIDRVPLRSYREPCKHQLTILSVYGCDILIPREALSPFVELNASPVLQEIRPKTVADCRIWNNAQPLDRFVIESTPVGSMGEKSWPVAVIEA